ncbi:MAG: hypothetical protein P8Y45_10095 [Exilibacterium sp.]
MKNKHEFGYTKIVANLPADLQAKLPRIINYRFGELIPDSNMLTIEIRGYTKPQTYYRFSEGNLEEQAVGLQSDTGYLCGCRPPRLLAIKGQWSAEYSSARPEANVLGGFGKLFLEKKRLRIPLEVVTNDGLSYYGAKLLAKGYLNQKAYGGGYYLEYHNLPHLWSPLSPTDHGFVLLGKRVSGDRFYLTAFAIPFGKAIYVPGGVLHCDGTLVGRYMAIYSVTPYFSTVHLMDYSGELCEIEVYY